MKSSAFNLDDSRRGGASVGQNVFLGPAEILGQSKEELKLKYDVTVHDPANGQVGVEFTLIDDGQAQANQCRGAWDPKSRRQRLIRHDGAAGFKGKSTVQSGLSISVSRTEWARALKSWLNTLNFGGKPLVMTHLSSPSFPWQIT